MATVIRSVPKYSNGTLSPEARSEEHNAPPRNGQPVAPGPGKPGGGRKGLVGGRKTASLSNATGRKQEARKRFQTADVAVPPWRWRGRWEEGLTLLPQRREASRFVLLFLDKWTNGRVGLSRSQELRPRKGGRQAAPFGPFPSFSRTEPTGRGSILLAYAKERAEKRRQARGRLLPVGSGEG